MLVLKAFHPHDPGMTYILYNVHNGYFSLYRKVYSFKGRDNSSLHPIMDVMYNLADTIIRLRCYDVPTFEYLSFLPALKKLEELDCDSIESFLQMPPIPQLKYFTGHSILSFEHMPPMIGLENVYCNSVTSFKHFNAPNVRNLRCPNISSSDHMPLLLSLSTLASGIPDNDLVLLRQAPRYARLNTILREISHGRCNYITCNTLGECFICYNDRCNTVTVCCKHFVCPTCLDKWIDMYHKCPHCRK